MAAEALEEEGQRQGYEIKVETRGSVGAKNQLTADEIAAADLVIIAADIEVDLSRFAGKKLYKTSTGAALKKTKEEFAKAFATATTYQQDAANSTAETKEEKTGAYKHLMTVFLTCFLLLLLVVFLLRYRLFLVLKPLSKKVR